MAVDVAVNRLPIAIASTTSRSPLKTKAMARRKTIIEKGNKSIWTLDSEAAKRIFQPAVVLSLRCLGAAAPFGGEKATGRKSRPQLMR